MFLNMDARQRCDNVVQLRQREEGQIIRTIIVEFRSMTEEEYMIVSDGYTWYAANRKKGCLAVQSHH